MTKNSIIFFSAAGGAAGNLLLLGQEIGLAEHIAAFLFAFFITSIALDYTAEFKRQMDYRRSQRLLPEDV